VMLFDQVLIYLQASFGRGKPVAQSGSVITKYYFLGGDTAISRWDSTPGMVIEKKLGWSCNRLAISFPRLGGA